MKINAISIKNFRNYTETKIKIRSKINLFLGNNGQGKTNLLEAIWVCVNGKSYRTSNIRNTISFSSKYGEISLSVSDTDSNNEIRTILEEKKKKILLNDKKIKNLSEIRRLLSTVIIDKDFKENLEKSYRPRRIILDSIVGNFSPNFTKKLKAYNQELKRKNELLASDGDKDIIDFIHSRLIQYSNELSIERKLWLTRMVALGEKILKKLDSSYSLTLEFQSDSLDKEVLINKLKENRLKERLYKKSIVGSHKDQISFLLNGSDAFEFASEGEKKSISIALKISEILILKKINSFSPIILVDEIGSEFDEKRLDFFYNFITNLGTQCFITANNSNILKKNKDDQYTIFSIINGDCKNIS